MRAIGLSGSALALALGACTFGRPSVVRVVDGRPLEGRYIDTATYALYARGAYHEAHDELGHAAQAYRAAAERDSESPAIWTRLGAVLCAQQDREHERAFARAERLDPEYAPLWRERAACSLGRGDAKAALAAAERAVALEPSDERSSLLFAEALARTGEPKDALRWLVALTVARPRAIVAWNALAKLAEKQGDRAQLLRAQTALAELARDGGVRAPGSPRERKPASLPALDAALLEGDLERARSLARSARLAPAALAVRAAALGRANLAREQAEHVLAADPTSGDAWVAAIVAADLEASGERFRSALGALERDALRPGALAARLLADLLARRVSDEAARAWLTAYGPLPPPSDELERRVSARLERELPAGS